MFMYTLLFSYVRGRQVTYQSTKVPIDLDVVDQVKDLFGTVGNAQRQLNLMTIPYHDVAAALKGAPIKEEYADEIIMAWRHWKRLFIRGVALGLMVDSSSWRLPKGEDLEDRLSALDEEEREEWKRKLKHA